jgi:hypothetical protein
MKFYIQLLVVVAAAGLGLATGLILRAKNSPSAEVSEEPSLAIPTQPRQFEHGQRNGPGRGGVRPGADSLVAAELERHLATASGDTRWLYWMEALEKATTTDFRPLAKLARGDNSAARLLAVRWIELDPPDFFDFLMAAVLQGAGEDFLAYEDANRMLLEQWWKRDPEAVIAALDDNSIARRIWGWDIAGIVMRTDAERGLSLLWGWHMDDFIPQKLGVVQWAANNPRRAAEFIMEGPSGYVSREAMEIIGTEWAKTNPAAALAFAAENRGELGTLLGATVIKQWAEGDFEAAADWLAGTAPQTRSRFSSSFVEAWAKQDASGALAWCVENLTGTTLWAAVTGVVKGVAEVDSGRAEALVSVMAPSQARAEAAVVVARDLFPKRSLKESMNPETVAWLAGLDSGSVQRVLREVDLRWRWIEADPQSLASFLATVPSDAVPARADTDLAQELARGDPRAALEWASGLPGERALSAGAAAFNQWFTAQPAEAIRWLHDLPPGDQRHPAFFKEAIRHLAYELRAPEVLAAMPPADRTAARPIIETIQLPENRRRVLLEALGQP